MKFKQYHLQLVLKSFDLGKIPLDVFLNRYFRSHKSIGSKDRLFITEKIYHYIRWKTLFEYLDRSPSFPLDPTEYRYCAQIPLPIRYGTPSFLYQLFSSAYGEEKSQKICWTNNSRAPLTLRINPLKTSREQLLYSLSQQFQLSLSPISPWGLYFHDKTSLSSLPEFRAGLFEIQDEACQVATRLVKAKPGDQILDYCAGSGGKSLAIAPLLYQSGQIYLHDIRIAPLKKARIRFRRAGIQNVQFHLPKQKKMDWVITDVPCSGTGTLRRNPDLKWRWENTPHENLSCSFLNTLLEIQRSIVRNAVAYLNDRGTILYMTCSILPQENEEQLVYFQKELGLEEVDRFQTLPVLNGMDGFFAAALKKKR